MLDQAEALRALVRDRIVCANPVNRQPKAHTIAITSGKGGVGKTSIAVNLAVLLARSGKNVRIIDADFGLSNAEVLLGVSPKHTLHDIMQGRVAVHDAWEDTALNVKLLSSGTGVEEMANMKAENGTGLLDYVVRSAGDGDIVIIDTAPGIDESVVSVLGMVDEVMVVTTPEPTSVADSYAAMKVLLSNHAAADITLLVNYCMNPGQASSISKGLDEICMKFLGKSFARYEYLPADPAVSLAIRAQRPLVANMPDSAIVPWLRKVAIKLDERTRKRHDNLQQARLMEA